MRNPVISNFTISFESTFVFLFFLVNQTLYRFYTFSFIDNPQKICRNWNITIFLNKCYLCPFGPVFNRRFSSMILSTQWLIFWVVKVLDYTYVIFSGFRQLFCRTSFSDNPFSLYKIIIIIRVGCRTLARSGY